MPQPMLLIRILPSKLVDVYPDGRAINIQDGIVRALYRDNDPLHPTPLMPGAVERYDIDLWATSIVFKKGHRIRIEVSSSNFPRYNRNLNTGLTCAGCNLSQLSSTRASTIAACILRISCCLSYHVSAKDADEGMLCHRQIVKKNAETE